MRGVRRFALLSQVGLILQLCAFAFGGLANAASTSGVATSSGYAGQTALVITRSASGAGITAAKVKYTENAISNQMAKDAQAQGSGMVALTAYADGGSVVSNYITPENSTVSIYAGQCPNSVKPCVTVSANGSMGTAFKDLANVQSLYASCLAKAFANGNNGQGYSCQGQESFFVAQNGAGFYVVCATGVNEGFLYGDLGCGTAERVAGDPVSTVPVDPLPFFATAGSPQLATDLGGAPIAAQAIADTANAIVQELQADPLFDPSQALPLSQNTTPDDVTAVQQASQNGGYQGTLQDPISNNYAMDPPATFAQKMPGYSADLTDSSLQPSGGGSNAGSTTNGGSSGASSSSSSSSPSTTTTTTTSSSSSSAGSPTSTSSTSSSSNPSTSTNNSNVPTSPSVPYSLPSLTPPTDASGIASALKSLFPDYTSLDLHEQQGTCPALTIKFYDNTVSTTEHCDLINQYIDIITLAAYLFWTLTALLAFLA